MAASAFLQSDEEWGARNGVLLESMAGLLSRFASWEKRRGLDVGCQDGTLSDGLARRTGARWAGVDPRVSRGRSTSEEVELVGGSAERLPFSGHEFDAVVLANVFEHIPPARRVPSLVEMRRVLRPGGVVVGQLPNPHFPIEAHSRLPFMGWLPPSLRERYWRLAPVSWPHDFFVVTARDLRREAGEAGFVVVRLDGFNYPPEAVPRRLRPLARVLQVPMRLVPWCWQFVLAAGDGATSAPPAAVMETARCRPGRPGGP